LGTKSTNGLKTSGKTPAGQTPENSTIMPCLPNYKKKGKCMWKSPFWLGLKTSPHCFRFITINYGLLGLCAQKIKGETNERPPLVITALSPIFCRAHSALEFFLCIWLLKSKKGERVLFGSVAYGRFLVTRMITAPTTAIAMIMAIVA